MKLIEWTEIRLNDPNLIARDVKSRFNQNSIQIKKFYSLFSTYFFNVELVPLCLYYRLRDTLYNRGKMDSR